MSTKSKIGIAVSALALLLLALVNVAGTERSLGERLDSVGAQMARTKAMSPSNVVVPPPPAMEPPDSLPLPSDDRLIRGKFGPLGWGWDVFAACAPEGGGDWDIEVIKVSVGLTLAGVLESLSAEPDLVVVELQKGGLDRGTTLRRRARQSCIYIAGHTSPETAYVTSLGINGRDSAPTHNIMVQGLGVIGAEQNGLQAICASRVVFMSMTVAFAENDLLGVTSDECGDHNSFNWGIVGPSGESGQPGNTGRGGGFFDGLRNTAVCGHVSMGPWVGFENVRRNPLLECSGNVTSGSIWNVTDGPRIQKASLELNIRNVRIHGGPMSRCDQNRAIRWFDNVLPVGSEMSVFLAGNVSIPWSECPWPTVTDQWGTAHTVFHYGNAGRRGPVLFEDAGSLEPHPDPEYPVPDDLSEAEILSGSGSSWHLTCAGEWEYRENDLDGRIKAKIRAGDLSYRAWENILDFTGGVPLAFPVGSPCPDVNDNGIPNEAETWLSGSSTGIPDVGELAPDGRPWILHYLSGR